MPLSRHMEAGRLAAVRESQEILEPHFSWCNFPYDEVQNRQFIEDAGCMLNQRRGLFMSVLHKQSYIYLGEVAIDKVADDRSSVNLMYWIRKDQWNKGYASAALQVLLREASYYLSVQYAEIMMEEENHASKRVAEKIGATYSRAIENMVNAKGQCKDVFCFHYYFQGVLPLAG